MYFSDVPMEEWPAAVDMRPSSPRPQGSLTSSSATSSDVARGQRKRSPLVSTKAKGKKVVEGEPPTNKRKMGTSSQPWRAMITEWSDDDGAPAAPSPAALAPAIEASAEKTLAPTRREAAPSPVPMSPMASPTPTIPVLAVETAVEKTPEPARAKMQASPEATRVLTSPAHMSPKAVWEPTSPAHPTTEAT